MCIPNVTIQRQSLLMVSYISLRLSMRITNTHTHKKYVYVYSLSNKKNATNFYILYLSLYLRDYSILLQRYLPHKKIFFSLKAQNKTFLGLKGNYFWGRLSTYSEVTVIRKSWRRHLFIHSLTYSFTVILIFISYG